MRSLIFWIFLLMFATVLFSSQELYNANQDQNFDIHNVTNRMTWNSSIFESENMDYDNEYLEGAQKIIYKFMDFLGYSLFETTKFFVVFGYNHPEYDFKLLMNVLMVWVIILTVIYSSPFLLFILGLLFLIYTKLSRFIKRA